MAVVEARGREHDIQPAPCRVPQPPKRPPHGHSAGAAFWVATKDAATGPNSGDGALEPRKGVYNIFLAATDMEGYRTDTMMVMCYDTVEQTVGVKISTNPLILAMLFQASTFLARATRICCWVWVRPTSE